MYVTLFNVAGPAIVGWLLLILLPKWRVTRFIAETAIFPVFLAVLYVVGLAPLLAAQGLGVMRDFGSAEGVTRLLARQDVALVAWIHILAFDQLVALYIYRDNMERRYVPLVVQSVLLFLTLMFGPVGFLAYYLLRLARRGRARDGSEFRVSSSESETISNSKTQARRAELETGDSKLETAAGARAAVASVVAEERVMFATGLAGVVLGLVGFAVMMARGRFVAPEGDLYKMATFDLATGIYLLTYMLYLPLAGFAERGRRRLRWWSVGLALYAYAVENLQIYRGLNPRFTRAGAVADQIAGALLGLTALGLIVVFLFVAARFFLRRTPIDGTLLLLAVRYACAAVFVAFAAGFWMGAVQGSKVGAAGSILPLHAAGFHGLQAVPLVALLLNWSRVSARHARLLVHAAGLAWLALCVGLWWQTANGRSVLEPSAATLASVASLLAWALCAAWAALAWRRSGHEKLTTHAAAT
jgi:hypothetical protein